jgi:transposase
VDFWITGVCSRCTFFVYRQHENWQLSSERCYNCQSMNNTNDNYNTSSLNPDTKTICKLGLDVHAGSIMVARQLEGLQPQPPQKFNVAKFLEWIKDQAQKHQVFSCYEAGPTGYWLHRELEEVGVTNYVICPTRLDSRGKGVNTDKTDATELLVRLDRYVAGNKKAFSVVTVPTPEQEQKRALSRQRDQLRRKRLSFAAQGRMLLLSQGYRYSNHWWKTDCWKKLQEKMPGWITEQLKIFRRIIQCVEREATGLAKRLASEAPSSLPKGMGGLTHEILEREVRDWTRFKNRRQLGSYSGLSGGVSGSGERSMDLSITKAGNRRLSCCLVECAWRMIFQQPDYWLVKKWARVLLNDKAHARRRKQAIVAFARQLLIDIWKWKLGKVTPQTLGWKMS